MSLDQRQLGQRLKTSSGASDVITILHQNPNDVDLLNALVNLCADPECWQFLRKAGVVELFMGLMLGKPGRLIKESDPFPLWLLPLQGLFNSLVGMQRCSKGFHEPENRETLTHLLEESPAICLYLFGRKSDICSSEMTAENIRGSLIGWLQAIWNGAGMLALDDIRKKLKKCHIVQISAWCWLSSQTRNLLSKAAIALADIIDQPNSTKEDFDQLIEASGSINHIAEAMNRALRDEDLIGDGLANNLNLLVGFTSQTVHMDIPREFSAQGIHKTVIAAIRRQVLLEASDDIWRIVEYGGMLVVNASNEATSPTEELTAMITDHSLIPLLGGILVRSVEQNKTCTSWLSLLSLLKHTCTCKSKDCRVRMSPSYIAALRTHLSWRWWSTLQKLGATKSDIAINIQKEWIILAGLAGLNKDAEREKFESGGQILGCWWVKCVNLVRPEPGDSLDLRKCSICKKALYCSSACQKGDWKDHKKKCRIWKEAS